jgi:hypothetical protein
MPTASQYFPDISLLKAKNEPFNEYPLFLPIMTLRFGFAKVIANIVKSIHECYPRTIIPGTHDVFEYGMKSFAEKHPSQVACDTAFVAGIGLGCWRLVPSVDRRTWTEDYSVLFDDIYYRNGKPMAAPTVAYRKHHNNTLTLESITIGDGVYTPDDAENVWTLVKTIAIEHRFIYETLFDHLTDKHLNKLIIVKATSIHLHPNHPVRRLLSYFLLGTRDFTCEQGWATFGPDGGLSTTVFQKLESRSIENLLNRAMTMPYNVDAPSDIIEVFPVARYLHEIRCITDRFVDTYLRRFYTADIHDKALERWMDDISNQTPGLSLSTIGDVTAFVSSCIVDVVRHSIAHKGAQRTTPSLVSHVDAIDLVDVTKPMTNEQAACILRKLYTDTNIRLHHYLGMSVQFNITQFGAGLDLYVPYPEQYDYVQQVKNVTERYSTQTGVAFDDLGCDISV